MQEHEPEYKEVCQYPSVPSRPRIEEMPYLRSYRYPSALAYKHQFPFRLVHIHSTGNSNKTEMRQLLTNPEFRRHAMEATTESSWHSAACFAFADKTFTPKVLYDACKE